MPVDQLCRSSSFVHRKIDCEPPHEQTGSLIRQPLKAIPRRSSLDVGQLLKSFIRGKFDEIHS